MTKTEELQDRIEQLREEIYELEDTIERETLVEADAFIGPRLPTPRSIELFDNIYDNVLAQWLGHDPLRKRR